MEIDGILPMVSFLASVGYGVSHYHTCKNFTSHGANSCNVDTNPTTKVPACELTNYSLRRNSSYVWASGRRIVRVVVTGIAAALPGRNGSAFSPPGVNNIERIIHGENFITPIDYNTQMQMLEKNVVLLKKSKDGSQKRIPIKLPEETINLCASIGKFDLTTYGVSESIASTMDSAVQVAVAAGLEALKDAGIVNGEGKSGWVLPAHMQATTGVVYATSFPALDTAISEVTKYFQSKSLQNTELSFIMAALRQKLHSQIGNQPLSSETETALNALQDEINKIAPNEDNNSSSVYEYDRKFLFRILVLGNAQLAQIIKARGPNMQTNAACAGSTQAIALAHDMIQLGRAERMIVVAGDNASSDTLMPWLGNGFRALGAATIKSEVKDAALPFDVRRSGMILGSGGIGMVLESEDGAMRRFNQNTPDSDDYSLGEAATTISVGRPYRCRLLGSLYTNSAYHGAALDHQHIAEEMERFIASVELELNITRSHIARNGVYFSHETSTNASPTASCACNEIQALRAVFGEDLKHLLILNTKGFTGHPMGVSFEDVVAAEVLTTGYVPPIANLTCADPYLGDDIKLSKGGYYPCKYAIRFAAGFGSQIALALYGSADT